jgi:hypothetical protein
MAMTSFKLIGVALVVSAIQLAAASAQVSEPAAAEARDPNFSIYSSGPPSYGPSSYGPSGAMAQTLPDDAWATPVPRPHRTHHTMKRY